jgi:hypothetical protein
VLLSLQDHFLPDNQHAGDVMSSQSEELTTMVCAQIKKLGYARSKRIRIYGEEFEVVSDPFPEGKGIAIQVMTKADMRVRTLQLPVTVLHNLNHRRARTEAA